VYSGDSHGLDEQIYLDVFGEVIVLTDPVRMIILQKHPEVVDFIDQLDQVLSQPDEIRRSVRDERVVLYYRFNEAVLDGKWVVVVVKQIDRNFISTLYATDVIKSGDVLWKRPT
jgi:hypothetical protein